MGDTLLDELFDWLRIPSISTGGGEPADLQRAAEWAAAKVRAAGGEAELVRIGDGNGPPRRKPAPRSRKPARQDPDGGFAAARCLVRPVEEPCRRRRLSGACARR